jgi:protein-disulfide isomerase
MSSKFWAVIGAILVIFFGILIFRGDHEAAAPASNKLTSHVKGEGAKSVTLVEYGDFQCPACESYNPVVDQIFAKYSADIKLQFRNFPLTSLHPNAFAAARAAEAAALQNKFWEMHDTLYASQNWQQWTVSSSPMSFFEAYAKQLGLNAATFKKDYVSDAVNKAINADRDEGNRLGITGTPTFFLDDKKLSVAANADDFSRLIDAEIAKKAKTQ